MGAGKRHAEHMARQQEKNQDIRKGYRWIAFIKDEEKSSKRKTDVYKVLNTYFGDYIGEIRWHGAWRQYCFFSDGPVILNRQCDDDLSHFKGQLMKQWRTNKK